MGGTESEARSPRYGLFPTGPQRLRWLHRGGNSSSQAYAKAGVGGHGQSYLLCTDSHVAVLRRDTLPPVEAPAHKDDAAPILEARCAVLSTEPGTLQ